MSSLCQVKPVQIIFDEDDIFIETLVIEIEDLKQMIEEIEEKYMKTENLRLICMLNSLRVQLKEKEEELDSLYL